MGLERVSLSLVSIIEELLEIESGGSGLENREYGRMDQSRWPCDNLYPQKFALTSPTRGGRSEGIVRSRTQATEFFLYSLVEALRYKSEGRGFETRWGEWIFSIYLILPARTSPWALLSL
jgi:hypothetical protein